MKLNRGQDEAIKHGNGPCMVLAPPGSGKTLIVTERTRYLIEESGVRPDQILVITFTRYAAREMKERFERLTAGKNYPVTFGTFHSIFYGILKCAYGIGANNLMSEKESSVLLQEVLDQTNIESTPEVEDEEELVRELLREVGMVKNGLCHLKDFHSKYLTQDEFAEVFRSYEHQKKELKKFDFDDMLVQCYALFRKKPEILQGWQKRFQYILIDEFQDIGMVHPQDAHVRPAPGAALLHGLGSHIEHAHKADGAGGHAACGIDGRAVLPQTGERKARAAAGFVDERGVFHRLENRLHAVLHRQHKAGRKLPQRAARIHQRGRVWQKTQAGHQLVKAVRQRSSIRVFIIIPVCRRHGRGNTAEQARHILRVVALCVLGEIPLFQHLQRIFPNVFDRHFFSSPFFNSPIIIRFSF